MTQRSMLPEVPSRGRRREEVTMAEFIAACKVAGEMAIPAGDPVYAYAERAGIHDDFLELAWLEFRERHLDDPTKKYRDWRATVPAFVYPQKRGSEINALHEAEINDAAALRKRARGPFEAAGTSSARSTIGRESMKTARSDAWCRELNPVQTAALCSALSSAQPWRAWSSRGLSGKRLQTHLETACDAAN